MNKCQPYILPDSQWGISIVLDHNISPTDPVAINGTLSTRPVQQTENELVRTLSDTIPIRPMLHALATSSRTKNRVQVLWQKADFIFQAWKLDFSWLKVILVLGGGIAINTPMVFQAVPE